MGGEEEVEEEEGEDEDEEEAEMGESDGWHLLGGGGRGVKLWPCPGSIGLVYRGGRVLVLVLELVLLGESEKGRNVIIARMRLAPTPFLPIRDAFSSTSSDSLSTHHYYPP